MPQVRYTPEGYPYYAPDASGDVTAPGEVKTGWPFAEYRPEQSSKLTLQDIVAGISPLSAGVGNAGTGIGALDLLTGMRGALNALGLRRDDQPKTWVENMLDPGTMTPGRAYAGRYVPQQIQPEIPGQWSEIDEFRQQLENKRVKEKEIADAQETAGLAMGGSMPFAQKAALGSGGGRAVVDAALQSPQGLSALKANPPKAPTFYSAVENAVMNSKQAAAPADQWLATLRNHPGVKQEELNWLGVEDFLNANKGQPVTKADLQDYINSHKVDVRDAMHRENGFNSQGWEPNSDTTKEISWSNPSGPGWKIVKVPTKNGPNRFEIRDPSGQKLGDFGNLEAAQGSVARQLGGTNAVQYADYQLPGGTNYNELLLTMPHDKSFPKGFKVEYAPSLSRYLVKNEKGELVGIGDTKDEALKSFDYTGDRRQYISSHWDEPNVLAHVRFNDRTVNGKKTLFLEEVQSDWHQTGRKEGYNIPQDAKNYQIEGNGPWKIVNKKTGEKAWETNRKNDAEGYLKDIQEGKILPWRTGKVPDAPFKKSWPELALKRMVRYAAENGYDAIAWTPGEVQAKRWSGTGESGHKKFYDEILVNAANKLAKGFSGKVGKEMMRTNEKAKGADRFNLDNYTKVHFLELPQGMRDAATQKGFPLFMGGHMLVPIDGEPELDETPSQKMKRFIEKQRRSGGRADPNGPPALSATIVPPPGYRNLMTDATP